MWRTDGIRKLHMEKHKMLQHIGFCRLLYRWNMWYTYSEPQIFRHQIFHWKLFDLSKLYTYHLQNCVYVFLYHAKHLFFIYISLCLYLISIQYCFNENIQRVDNSYFNRTLEYCGIDFTIALFTTVIGRGLLLFCFLLFTCE